MKTKVPKAYFIEMSREMNSRIAEAKNAPKRQLSRIKNVILSGKDREVMNNGSEVSLEKLMRYYLEALSVDVRALELDYEKFLDSHEIDPKMKSGIDKAIKEAKTHYNRYIGYREDENNYNLTDKLTHKYFLSDKDVNKLLGVTTSIEIEQEEICSEL